MKYLVIIGFLCACLEGSSQDSSVREKKLEYSGYVKDLFWVRSNKDFSEFYSTDLVHNRVNLKWKPLKKITARLEVRNRLYWGDDVRTIPNFKDGLRNQNELVNLSALWIGKNSTVLHTNIERFWLEYRGSKWNLKSGRQRINWGIANTWNPNDLFNTYNFLDFDYEERPGSDAVKLQYLVNGLSNIEVAVAGTGEHPIAAGKYSTNFKKYDLQGIVGLYQKKFTAGFGWAGSIGEVGFKGEMEFYPGKNDSASRINLTIEGDYIFKNGWYLSSAVLYNERGLHRPLTDWTKLSFQASPRNLMPARWSFLINSSKEFTPLFSGNMSVVFSPGLNMLILFPSLKYNLTTNLDADLVWQSFFAEVEKFQAFSHTGFLRVKWSF